jgi:hypothetical protein
MMALMSRWLTEPWITGRLDEAREAFRQGRIDEWKFRSTLAMMGYTRYGVDAEVRDQLSLMVE